MAGKPETTPEIARLIERITASRSGVAVAAIELRDRWDVPTRVRKSLRSHPKAWFGAAAGVGLLVAGWFARRRRPVHPNPGTPPRKGVLATLVATAAGPAVKWLVREWLLRQSRQRLERIARH